MGANAAICKAWGHQWRNVRAWNPATWPAWFCRRCHHPPAEGAYEHPAPDPRAPIR